MKFIADVHIPWREMTMKNLLVLTLFIAIFYGSVSAQEISYQVQKIPYAGYLEPDKLTIVASFDGSKGLDRWQEILDFGNNQNVKFTFFISGVFFLSDDEKDKYLYPVNVKKTGISDIGFGGKSEDVAMRKKFVAEAIRRGHDVQTHLNGHFDGSRWTQDNWRIEFKQFNDICGFLPVKVRHVRFPLLAMNHKVFEIMKEFGILSITSAVENDFENFNRITIAGNGKNYSFLEFPIAYERENKSNILLMDYNFYVYDEKHHLDVEKSQQDMINLYMEEAHKCFREKRPFFISHHFSNWNNAAYWNAMKQVIIILKKRYPIKFVTVSELYDLLSK